jgi:hypothetical protein
VNMPNVVARPSAAAASFLPHASTAIIEETPNP